MSTINERIAQCIATTGLTKTAFAQKINLSQPHMSKIALGHSAPTERTIADICREFNINKDWLRTGKGEMFKSSKDATADQLATEYGLDDLGRQIMSAYLDLGENDRLAVGRLIQKIVDERMNAGATGKDVPAPVVDTKIETNSPEPDVGKDVHVPAASPDIATRMAELERQNQELAAKVAAMEEEDALLGLTDVSSESPSVSVGNFSPAPKAKK